MQLPPLHLHFVDGENISDERQTLLNAYWNDNTETFYTVYLCGRVSF